LLLHPAFSSPQANGSICVAPLPEPARGQNGERYAGGPPSVRCDAEKYSFKIDTQPPRPWPEKESIKIEDLGLSVQHRVVVLCGGKPMQSAAFRFSGFRNQKVCLFLNDLYWTVQLWPAKGSPWCKCK